VCFYSSVDEFRNSSPSFRIGIFHWSSGYFVFYRPKIRQPVVFLSETKKANGGSWPSDMYGTSLSGVTLFIPGAGKP
jgi:hypothetical protein